MNSGRISWLWIPIQILEFPAILPWLPMMQLWAWTPLFKDVFKETNRALDGKKRNSLYLNWRKYAKQSEYNSLVYQVECKTCFLTLTFAAKTTGPGLWRFCFAYKIINFASPGTQKFNLYLVETNVSCFHSLFSYDVTKIQVSSSMWYHSTLKPLYRQILGSKGFFVLGHRTLEVQAFAWRGI